MSVLVLPMKCTALMKCDRSLVRKAKWCKTAHIWAHTKYATTLHDRRSKLSTLELFNIDRFIKEDLMNDLYSPKVTRKEKNSEVSDIFSDNKSVFLEINCAHKE